MAHHGCSSMTKEINKQLEKGNANRVGDIWFNDMKLYQNTFISYIPILSETNAYKHPFPASRLITLQKLTNLLREQIRKHVIVKDQKRSTDSRMVLEKVEYSEWTQSCLAENSRCIPKSKPWRTTFCVSYKIRMYLLTCTGPVSKQEDMTNTSSHVGFIWNAWNVVY
jgi:hypothetical protein